MGWNLPWRHRLAVRIISSDNATNRSGVTIKTQLKDSTTFTPHHCVALCLWVLRFCPLLMNYPPNKGRLLIRDTFDLLKVSLILRLSLYLSLYNSLPLSPLSPHLWKYSIVSCSMSGTYLLKWAIERPVFSSFFCSINNWTQTNKHNNNNSKQTHYRKGNRGWSQYVYIVQRSGGKEKEPTFCRKLD